MEGRSEPDFFLGSGTAIKSAGPALIVAYLITGIFSYLMMRAVGELLLSDLHLHSFIDFVREYLGDRWEFAIGWAYWLSWASLAMADLTASGSISVSGFQHFRSG